MIVPMKTIFPGDNPVVLAQREPPLNPVQNTVDSFFDDKMVVVNASRHANRCSCTTTRPDLETLFDPRRGPAPPR